MTKRFSELQIGDVITHNGEKAILSDFGREGDGEYWMSLITNKCVQDVGFGNLRNEPTIEVLEESIFSISQEVKIAYMNISVVFNQLLDLEGRLDLMRDMEAYKRKGGLETTRRAFEKILGLDNK